MRVASESLFQHSHTGGSTGVVVDIPQQDVPQQSHSATIPMDLQTPDLFPLLDDSFFAQLPFPLDLDFDLSPQSLVIDDHMCLSTNLNSSIVFSKDGQEQCFHTGAASKPCLVTDNREKIGESRSKSLVAPFKASHTSIDDSSRFQMLTELRENYHVGDEQLRQLPSSRALDNFLSRFFRSFQRHLPILHVPTFNATNSPTPLVLAMCSIGALYTLNRSSAAALRVIASDALQSNRPRKYRGVRSEVEPVWQTQCNLLISFGAMFGGSSSVTIDAMNDLGSFVQPFTLRRAELTARTLAGNPVTWDEWIEAETIIRLLCGIYMASSLNSATYGVAPGFSGFRDLQFPLPAEEQLWEASTADEWQQRYADVGSSTWSTTVADALSQLVFSLDADLANTICTDHGAFATTIIMHGVNVHMYYLSHSLSGLLMAGSDEDALDQALRLAQRSQTERILGRCHEFLKAWQVAHEGSELSRYEESLIFNCQALLRLSYVRVFGGMRCFDRTTLVYEDSVDVAAALNAYVNAPQVRNAFFTKAAEQVMFCFTAPICAGHMVTRKTAALTWSIEHAIASWEGMLFLTKWVFAIETQASELPPTNDEARVLGLLKEALQDAESPYDDARSLAAQVTTTWALFMDDVWVWEVTTRMGKILRCLADAYGQRWTELK